MIYIAHRGNINGRIIEKENNPSYIKNALKQGYDVELDVWYSYEVFMLGHDFPQYSIDESFLTNRHIWCHAKDILTLSKLLALNVHCFFHNVDECVLTSRNRIWVYPGKSLCAGVIAVLPETTNYSIDNLKVCSGICSDIIFQYREKFK